MVGAMDTSFLQNQVTTIITQLHSIFDEIGIPRNERESRETELFTALSEALNNQLHLANSEKSRLTEEAKTIITTIKQMEKSLEDETDNGYNLNTGDLQVTYPLADCLRDLKEKYNIIHRLHRERFEQVKKLVQALESYSSHLESNFVKIRLPPTNTTTCAPTFDLSPNYVAKLDNEFSRVYDEYNKRVNIVQTTSEEIVRLWSDLGVPQAQTDSMIVQHYRDAPEQLGLHQTDMDRLKSRRDKLLAEKGSREKRLRETKTTIEALWDRLGVQEADRKAFLAANRGCGLRAINEFEDELARLNELKRQNLHLFVEDARVRIQELWDGLYFCEEEMLEFTPAFSDVYTDALLSEHEVEIERLITLKEQRAPILAAIEKHKSLIADREALTASAADASRLLLKPQKGEKRDPGKLLREEKMRKRIAKELPKIAADLTKTLQAYEEEYGRPFLVHGESYLEELEILDAKPAPPRSKTPNGLPPRSKTPAPAPSASKPTANTLVKPVQPPRPKSAIGNATLGRANGTKTPNGIRPPVSQHNPSASVSSTVSKPSGIPVSPSKLPTRAPLSHLPHGSNSPERRLPQSTSMQSFKSTSTGTSQIGNSHLEHSKLVQPMGPPRAPPPKMRGLMETVSAPKTAFSHLSADRPGSVLSHNDSQMSSRMVRPMSPEDVYTNHQERMSYLSTSVIGRNQIYGQQAEFHSSIHANTARPPSRQSSNTSSNMTTGTTITNSENWETFSDTSEVVPEQEIREIYHSKLKRSGAQFGHMAPPSKMRVQERIEEVDENNLRVGSNNSWVDEPSETY